LKFEWKIRRIWNSGFGEYESIKSGIGNLNSCESVLRKRETREKKT